MSYDILKKRLKENNLPHLMHFYGEETFLLESSVSLIKKKLLGDSEDFNLIVLEGDVSADEIDVSLNTPPFFGEAKLILLRELGIFKSGAKNKEIWKAAFSDVPPYLYIIACESNFDKRNAAYKAFAENALTVNFEHREKSEIRGWCAKQLQKKKKLIDNDALTLLIDSVGVDMQAISAQLDKIAAYTGERDRVTAADVRETVKREFFTKEYVLTDAMLSKNKKLAQNVLSELLFMRTDPIRLLFIVASSYMSAYKAKVVLLSGGNAADAAKILKLPRDFMAKKYVEFARKLDAGYLKNAISVLKDADLRVKNGSEDPETCIRRVVAEL